MNTKNVLVRIAQPLRDKLWEVIFSRYPSKEWGTFIRLGWAHTSKGLVFTLQAIDIPEAGDLNTETWITEINSAYSRKMVRLSQGHEFAVGFVHSHPEGYGTVPSDLDDDMENYYSRLLKGYDDRPFVSLIFSRKGKALSASGRVYWNGEVQNVTKFVIEGCRTAHYGYDIPKILSADALKKIARLASSFSEEAAEILAGSTVGIVGLSGTGSPAAELLCRAGVGKIIGVDSDIFSDSNLERIHGSGFIDIEALSEKARIAKRHLAFINPECEFVAIQGRIPQKEVMDELLWCDIVVGATDLFSARVALSELSFRYLVPVIDMGVAMEGDNGHINAQVSQVNRLLPSDACVFCRGIIDSQIAAQELMPAEELMKRKEEAKRALRENRKPDAYWKDMPQLNSVGYLTTFVGSIVTGYVIGYLTSRFKIPYNRVEISFTDLGIQLVQKDAKKNSECVCAAALASSDQLQYLIVSTAPDHWPPVKFL